MNQMVTRKSAEEKDNTKRTDSPVKEMKKKIAANAEKEKQAAEKIPEKPAEKTEKPADKHADKPNAEKDKKAADKAADKKAEKSSEKSDKKVEKNSEKAEKKVENKQPEKNSPVEKKDAEKKEDKGEKSGKSDKDQKPGQRPKQNGSRAHNGVSDVTLSANGTSERDVTENGTVSDEEDDVMLVIDYDNEQDELFPELSYDDTSDVEGFEPPTPESHSRSFTRRSQVKVARTPETPRPASDKQTDKETAVDDPKDSKVLKMKDDATSTDRKLRSSDSPKKETKKPQDTQESPKKDGEKHGENGDQDLDVIEIDDDEPRKPDTNYSKSRVKVSPYRRSMRIADQTTSSVVANYTGNNTTMEMDITASSSFGEDPSLDDSSYLSGLRSIRGRRSYKQLKEITLRHAVNRSARAAANMSGTEPTRPTGTVVGRKRKPDSDEGLELATEAGETGETGVAGATALSKRMRLLERIAHPFRRCAVPATLPARRAAEIVGINTDLPLTAPVSTPETFDPESLKAAASATAAASTPAARAPPPELAADRDPKRCALM